MWFVKSHLDDLGFSSYSSKNPFTDFHSDCIFCSMQFLFLVLFSVSVSRCKIKLAGWLPTVSFCIIRCWSMISGVAKIRCQEGHRSYLDVYRKRLSTYNRCQTLYWSKYTEKINCCKSSGTRTNSWRRQCCWLPLIRFSSIDQVSGARVLCSY